MFLEKRSWAKRLTVDRAEEPRDNNELIRKHCSFFRFFLCLVCTIRYDTNILTPGGPCYDYILADTSKK